MALRKPIVLVNGQFQQLQAADTLEAPQTGGDFSFATNNDSVAVVICTPVYADTSGTFKRAQANAAATSGVIGLAGQAPSIAAAASGGLANAGSFSATTAQWDAVTGQTGGLTTNAIYFLDATTVGRLTTTAPSTIGQLVVVVGRATSTTSMTIQIQPAILL